MSADRVRAVIEPGRRLCREPAPPTGPAWRITGHRRRLPYPRPYGADDAMARIDSISA